MPDSLPAIVAELEQLADRPVEAHPDVLERLHQTLADQLDGTG